MLMEVNKDTVESFCEHRQDLIWVVEDHEDCLLLLNFILTDLYHEQVICFNNGQAVLEQAVSLPPSLIFLDVVLPGINGVEIVQRLRKNPLLQHTPIVAVTALVRRDDPSLFLQSGFTDYLSKPYSLDDIASILRRYLKIEST